MTFFNRSDPLGIIKMEGWRPQASLGKMETEVCRVDSQLGPKPNSIKESCLLKDRLPVGLNIIIIILYILVVRALARHTHSCIILV